MHMALLDVISFRIVTTSRLCGCSTDYVPRATPRASIPIRKHILRRETATKSKYTTCNEEFFCSNNNNDDNFVVGQAIFCVICLSSS